MEDKYDERRPLLADSETTAKVKLNGSLTVTAKNDNKKEDDVTKKSASFGQLFRTATRLDVAFMLLGSVASFAHGAGWPVLFLFFGEMTDQFLAPVNTTNVTVPDDFSSEMTKYSLYYVYIGAVVFVSSYFQVSLWTTTCERQVHKIRKQFFEAILRQEIGWFDVHQSGELTARLADDLERVREGLGDKFSFLIQFLAQFIAGFGIGFWKGWKLALVLLSLTPVLATCGAFLSKFVANLSKREQQTYAEAGSVAEEVLSCIRTVTSFNGQRQDIKRYEVALKKSRKLGIRKSVIVGFGLGFTFLCMFSAYALGFWYGTELIKDGEMTGGAVLTVFFCVIIGTFSIGNATPHLSSVAQAKGAAAVLIDIIDTKPSIDSSSTKGKRLKEVSGEIKFNSVNFHYPTREDVQVLKDFTLTVKPGQTVALVGSSGCGKSTVVNLIQRFYDPDANAISDQGQIMVDGIDIRELNLKSWREQIGVVSQEPILFGLTINENILLGRPTARFEEIVQAAKAANCHDFISDLPQGYDTAVGERGAQLSGGQKQRVAIARALIRDPKILLLDEATSALDTESERIVQAALDNARQGRTTIVIAHRLSTIQNADIIYVIEDGQIVESGKHSDLMAAHGAYHQLVTVQMLIEAEDEDEDEDEAFSDEKLDQVPNGTASPRKRKRTISSEGTKRQLSTGTHRQTSRQLSKTRDMKGKDGLVDIEEVDLEETAEKPKYCRILQENKQEWPFIVMGCMAAAINGCTMPAFAVFFGEMINVFMNAGQDSTFWSMMFLLLGGVQFFTNFIQSTSFGNSGEKLTMRLRLQTFRAMLRQDISYFDDPKHATGALTTRLATDASLVKNATGIRIATLIQALFGMVAALTISFIYGWQLALVVLGGIPFMVVAGAFQMKTVMGHQKKDTKEQESGGKIASEAIENIRTVQSLTRERHFYDNYSNHLLQPLRTNMKLAQIHGFAFGFSQGIVFMLYAGAFRFGAYMVDIGEMTAPNVYKVFFAISFTGLVIGQSSSFLPDYSKAAHATGLIFKILDTIPLIDVFSRRGKVLSKMSGRIEFKDVKFNYPMRPDVPVLKGISLDVEPGQTVALVGPSGCGKSTMVSLLQRFYDPQQGAIVVDGIDVRDINIVRLRYLVSVVSQEPILFDCSIRDNIAYGLDKPLAMDEVIAAARAANIHEFIVNLPLQYETVVGEKGTQLSGGQKQRVAIARALVRNPTILLLDEATSALDTESEQVVQAALDNAQKGRTCLVIAHRLSTIQNADVIYVMDNGNIVEHGSHNQLLNRKGVYSQLVSGQQLNK